MLTERGIEEPEHRCGEEEVTFEWLSTHRLPVFGELNPGFEIEATGLALLDEAPGLDYEAIRLLEERFLCVYFTERGIEELPNCSRTPSSPATVPRSDERATATSPRRLTGVCPPSADARAYRGGTLETMSQKSPGTAGQRLAHTDPEQDAKYYAVISPCSVSLPGRVVRCTGGTTS